MRWLAVFLVLLGLLSIGDPSTAYAVTPTPTPSPTATPYVTPDVLQAMILPAQTDEAGTPIPPQPLGFRYSITAGDAAIIIFLAVIEFVLCGIFIIWIILRRRES